MKMFRKTADLITQNPPVHSAVMNECPRSKKRSSNSHIGERRLSSIGQKDERIIRIKKGPDPVMFSKVLVLDGD